MRTTHQKSIIMPSNGSLQRKPFDWHALLLALTVSLASGSFIFAWDTHADVAVIKDQNQRNEKDKDDLKQVMNQIQLDIREVRESTIRNERSLNNQLQKP